jgi:hypothetical protein
VSRPALRVVTSPGAAAAPASVAFCGYCGARPDAPNGARICADCGLGVVLVAAAELAPAPRQAALVVDGALCVCAVSAGAEELLGVAEPNAVNRHLAELLVPAAAEARGATNLLELVISAAGGGGEDVQQAVIRPAGIFGVRYVARVGACGPPSAALVVLADEAV